MNMNNSGEASNSTIMKNIDDVCLSFNMNFEDKFNNQFDILKIENGSIEFNNDPFQTSAVKYYRFRSSFKAQKKRD